MKRLFTIQEANRMLSRLERDLKAVHVWIARARRAQREKEMFRSVGHRPDGRLILQREYEEASAELRNAVREIDAIIDGIHAEGCLVKDISRGLIDFPAVLGGEEVLLCWQLGEPRVAYYHDYFSGYAGRRAIDADMEDGHG